MNPPHSTDRVSLFWRTNVYAPTPARPHTTKLTREYGSDHRCSRAHSRGSSILPAKELLPPLLLPLLPLLPLLLLRAPSPPAFAAAGADEATAAAAAEAAAGASAAAVPALETAVARLRCAPPRDRRRTRLLPEGSSESLVISR
jgi:hypothetical protein